MSGLNIADIFETVVATVPDKPALVVRTGDGHDEVRFSFAELDARVNRLAHALRRARDRRGRPRRLPSLRRQPVRRGHAGRLQGARRPGERELPLRRRGADVPLRQRRPEGRRSPSPTSRTGRRGPPRRSPGRARWWSPTSATSSCSPSSPTPRPTSATARPTIATACGPAARPACRRASCGARKTSTCRRSAASGNPLLGIEPVTDLDDVADTGAQGHAAPGNAHALPADARRRVLARVLRDPRRARSAC